MEMSDHLHDLADLFPGRSPCTHCIGGWVGPRTGRKAVAKRKIIRPVRERNPYRPAHSLVTMLTELLQLLP